MNDAHATGAAGHLDLDALADAVAGEGDAVATAHLASCPSCASRLRELEAAEQRVVAVLSALPPPTVPADLEARLSAALAAEAPLDPAVATTGASVTALPAREASRRRTWLPAAAAVVLLASGAGLGWSLLGGSSGSDDGDTAATGRELLASESGTDYADPAALAGSLPAVLAGTASALTESRSSDAAGTAAGSAPAADDAATSAQAPEAATLAAPDALERLRTTDGLAACLAGLQDDGQAVEPLAVDYATYSGGPALAVLLPDPDPSKVAVFVVGPECAQADPQLLHYVRVDRPE